jgi:hypothetical protein
MANRRIRIPPERYPDDSASRVLLKRLSELNENPEIPILGGCMNVK